MILDKMHVHSISGNIATCMILISMHSMTSTLVLAIPNKECHHTCTCT